MLGAGWTMNCIDKPVKVVFSGFRRSVFSRKRKNYGNPVNEYPSAFLWKGCMAGLVSIDRLEAALGDLLEQVVDELLFRFNDRFFLAADADCDGAFFDFSLAENCHVWHAFEAGVADFCADFVGGAIDCAADAEVGEFGGEGLGKVDVQVVSEEKSVVGDVSEFVG